MFTGIVEELGTVESLTPGADPARLRIRSPRVLEGIALGDSIAVSGCCLTVTAVEGEVWSADVIATTLAATSLGDLAPRDRVNLERCVRADGRLDGHIVQGHVDGIGRITGREESAGTTLLRLLAMVWMLASALAGADPRLGLLGPGQRLLRLAAGLAALVPAWPFWLPALASTLYLGLFSPPSGHPLGAPLSKSPRRPFS